MSDIFDPAVDGTLDATGLNCPEPVMMLHQHIRDLPPGGLLKVIATQKNIVCTDLFASKPRSYSIGAHHR